MTTQPQHPDHDPTTLATPDAAGDQQPGDLRLGDLLDLSQLIVAEGIDVIAGDPPVPISVWRLAGADHQRGGPEDGHDLADGFPPHLAAPLVATFSRRGQTILDLNHDPAIQGAAGAEARRYRTITDPADPTELASLQADLTAAVDLLVLRWPRPHSPNPDHPTTTGGGGVAVAEGLFAACRRLLAPGGFTVVALAPPPPGPPYVEHAQVVIPAATQAGLGYLQHIIVVTAPISGEPVPRFTAPADRAALRATAHIRAHLDLLVFVLRSSPASSPKSPGAAPGGNDRPGRTRRRGPRSPR